MQSLIDKLAKNQQLFVRCIKPCDNLNDDGRFNADKVRHQIQYLGLIENSRLRQAGFWRRYQYNKFVQRFKMLCDKEHCLRTNRTYDVSDRDYFKPICQEILLKTDLVNSNDLVESNRFAFGKTTLFLRDPELIEALEIKRVKFLEMIILKIQTVIWLMNLLNLN